MMMLVENMVIRTIPEKSKDTAYDLTTEILYQCLCQDIVRHGYYKRLKEEFGFG